MVGKVGFEPTTHGQNPAALTLSYLPKICDLDWDSYPFRYYLSSVVPRPGSLHLARYWKHEWDLNPRLNCFADSPFGPLRHRVM